MWLGENLIINLFLFYIGFGNNITRSHEFKSTLYYNVFWTDEFIEVVKSKNVLSIYEL